ncbi:sec1 family domain-containing protein MIP3 isoform X2 [Andrographis paniculata]|nr:sec1 family domain-containing protein MIP3 isoform X2 [Andrographis paniculata]
MSGDGMLDQSTEEEGWSQLTSMEDDADEISGVRLPQEDYSPDHSDDVGQKLKISVHHFPLILCPLSPRVFVLPSEGSVAEASLSTEHESSISYGLPPLSTGHLMDTEDVTPGATLTAQFLYHFALKMDLKLEIFSLGDLSKNVGKLLTDMSSLYDVGRRKRSAGLLLIDRTLDLLTPCCHGDSLIDRMFTSLPRRQRIPSFSQVKGGKSQLKNCPVKLERSPLAVEIPLQKFIKDEDSKNNSQLLESIESFLYGWYSVDLDSKDMESMKHSKKLNDETQFQRDRNELLHGAFVSTDNFRGAPYLEALLDRRTKDGAMLIKKWLQECLRRENISSDLKIHPGFSKSDLESFVRALAMRQPCLLKNRGIVQLAAATLHAFDELHSASWDAFSSAEKILRVNAADTSQSLAAQISDLINKTTLVASQVQKDMKKSAGLFSLHDALLMTVIAYVLAGENFPTSGSDGPFSWQEEHFMKDAIVDAIIENPTISNLKFLHGLSEELKSKLNKTESDEMKKDTSDPLPDVEFDDDQWGAWGDDDEDKETTNEQQYDNMQLKLELKDRVDHFFKFLHKLSRVRSNSTLREGLFALESRHTDDPYTSKGLLHKLLTSILDKQDVPGLEYHSSTVGRLFKSGFGRFGLGQAKPSLGDQNVILVFVIGGINGVEVREAHEALTGSNRSDIELILGGTTFLTPDDMRELLLGDYSHA